VRAALLQIKRAPRAAVHRLLREAKKKGAVSAYLRTSETHALKEAGRTRKSCRRAPAAKQRQ
jgi:hypothetical protein